MTFPDTEEAPSKDDIVTEAKYLVNLYIAAGKYLVPELQQLSKHEFRATIEKLEGADLRYITSLAKHVYSEHPEAANDLREPLVLHVVALQLKGLKGEEGGMQQAQVKELFEEVPGLCIDVVVFLCNKYHELRQKVEASGGGHLIDDGLSA